MNKPKLIVMLTYNDQTVKNASEVFDSCKDLPVQDWGFKNIGLPVEEMKKLVAQMKQANKTTYMEVVTYTEDTCLAAAELAIACKFDYLMGTVYFPSVHELLKKANMKYMPFCGKVWGNPSVLGNTYEDVIDSANELARHGCYGTDILAYRFVGDPEELLRRFVKEVKGLEIVIAGSVESYARMDFVKSLGVSGMTMGSALFNKKFVPDGSFRDNLSAVAAYMQK